MPLDFSQIRAIIMDMDGVLWRGDSALPGLVPWFDFLKTRRIPYCLATNNSSKSPLAYTRKLAQMGLPDVPPDSIITSALATAATLRQRYPHGARVYVLGEDGLRQALSEAGHQIVEDDAEIVVAGIDFQVTYAKLKQSALLIRRGALFIGTNADPSYPSPEGLLPGAGSFIALLETATGTRAEIIGKPGRAMFQTALERLGTAPHHTLMIGDRLDTDILGAQQVGIHTALVLTGVTTRDQLLDSAIQPDAIFEHLPHLLAHWANTP